MRLIDADDIYPWYIDAFDFDPNEVRFSMNDIRDNLDNIPTHQTPSNTLDINVCIDKQAVIDEISRLINEKHHIKTGTSSFRDGVIDGYARVLSMVNKLPSVKAKETECEKCYWSDEKGCSIFCRAWNRYTSHGGFCHQYAELRGEQDG